MTKKVNNETRKRNMATPKAESAPKVFISYSHDSPAHDLKVLGLSDRLVSDGLDCILDQYVESPIEGWPKWMQENLEASEFIVVVCTNEYNKRANGNALQGVGKGVKFESLLALQDLYDNDSLGAKFVPVVFSDEDAQHIPKPLRPFQRFVLSDSVGYELLYRRLSGQPRIVKPPRGSKRVLPVGENITGNPGGEVASTIRSSAPQKTVSASPREAKLFASEIELRLDRDFETFGPDDQARLLRSIAELLKISEAAIRITRITKGSVLIRLELSTRSANTLEELFYEGRLTQFDIVDFEVTGGQALKQQMLSEPRDASISTNTGVIKYFNEAKGFGFITPDSGGPDLFFHVSMLERFGIRVLQPGERVRYELTTNNGRDEARNIQFWGA